ncbi:hypothetical protein [Pseudomonas soli]|uniref:Uncharacterized protein n=1 Tax=Pseudomonas soli TaxID=1306993 RepID=A0AAJ5MIV8_9PSED|nr:hypothetical protein [Pseudomonas soli]UXZ43562.1 hypothetical protein K7K07_15915 [Pseudomonas soli]
MNTADFEFSYDRFSATLTRNHRGLTTAQQLLAAMVAHWPTFTSTVLNGNASIAIDQTGNISGDVLGKQFEITFDVVANDDQCRVEALILVPSIHADRKVEAGRFYFSPEGIVQTISNEVLLLEDEDVMSYRLLCAVLRKVLSSPRTA